MNNNNKNKNKLNQKKELKNEYRKLAKNSFYNFLNSYTVIFFSLVTSFFTARLISKSLWGLLIISQSYVNIFILILNFFPPSVGPTYHYYLPRFITLNQNNKLKSFIKYSLIIRLFFVLVVFIIAILIYLFFTGIFNINLGNYSYLFFILSPLILILGIDKILLNIFRPLNMFKTVFIMVAIRYLIYTVGLIFLFFFDGVIEVSFIAYISLFANLIPFVINIIILFFVLNFKIKKTSEIPLKFKEILKNLYAYGYQLSFQSFIDSTFNEFRIQSVGYFESLEMVTGYNISVHYRNISLESVKSLNSPLIISFSSLYAKDQKEQLKKFFKIAFYYFTFLILIITGIVYFFIDFFLRIIYGKSFLKFSIILKLMIITIIFSVQNSLFFSMLRSSPKYKYIIPISLMSALIKMPAFLLGLILYGLIGAIIALFIANVIYFILIAILNFKIFNIKLNIKKSFLQYIIFFISLGFAIILEILYLSQINYMVLEALNLLIFQNLNFFSLMTFLLTFLFLNYIFKIFSKSDVESIERFFEKDTFLHKIIRKMLRFLKKIIRD
ncbi:MAG: hypothetical protein ACFE9X_07850 [Promethearchaeota archaeon]